MIRSAYVKVIADANGIRTTSDADTLLANRIEEKLRQVLSVSLISL